MKPRSLKGEKISSGDLAEGGAPGICRVSGELALPCGQYQRPWGEAGEDQHSAGHSFPWSLPLCSVSPFAQIIRNAFKIIALNNLSQKVIVRDGLQKVIDLFQVHPLNPEAHTMRASLYKIRHLDQEDVCLFTSFFQQHEKMFNDFIHFLRVKQLSYKTAKCFQKGLI